MYKYYIYYVYVHLLYEYNALCRAYLLYNNYINYTLSRLRRYYYYYYLHAYTRMFAMSTQQCWNSYVILNKRSSLQSRGRVYTCLREDIPVRFIPALYCLLSILRMCIIAVESCC